jgi:hypothetical protein
MKKVSAVSEVSVTASSELQTLCFGLIRDWLLEDRGRNGGRTYVRIDRDVESEGTATATVQHTGLSARTHDRRKAKQSQYRRLCQYLRQVR